MEEAICWCLLGKRKGLDWVCNWQLWFYIGFDIPNINLSVWVSKHVMLVILVFDAWKIYIHPWMEGQTLNDFWIGVKSNPPSASQKIAIIGHFTQINKIL